MTQKNQNLQKSVALNIDGVGSVLFKKSIRARHLNIRIKHNTGVQVSVPKGMSFYKAKQIVRTKTDWIHRNLEKINNNELKNVLYDGSQPIKSRHHILDVRAGRVTKISIILVNGVIKVRYPENYKITDPIVQSAIKTALIAAYRKEAKAYLPARLAYLANEHGFEYNKVFIKNHKSRWGSCSAKNNINLNLHLMRLPDELIDYVIMHELVHTKIKNHSREYWTLLENICGDVKEYKKRIRNYVIN